MHPAWRTESFFTHQPVLKYYAEQATKPILELGCGEGSTQLLHDICAAKGVDLVTVENNRDWMNKYQHLAGPHHVFVAVEPDLGDAQAWINTLRTHKLDQKDWGLVFIDQAPWEARTRSMQLLKDHTDVMVIHDVDYFPEHGIFGKVLRHIQRDVPGLYDFRDQFARFKLYYPPTPWCCSTGPPTLVGTQRPHVVLTAAVPCEFMSACPDL